MAGMKGNHPVIRQSIQVAWSMQVWIESDSVGGAWGAFDDEGVNNVAPIAPIQSPLIAAKGIRFTYYYFRKPEATGALASRSVCSGVQQAPQSSFHAWDGPVAFGSTAFPTSVASTCVIQHLAINILNASQLLLHV